MLFDLSSAANSHLFINYFIQHSTPGRGWFDARLKNVLDDLTATYAATAIKTRATATGLRSVLNWVS